MSRRAQPLADRLTSRDPGTAVSTPFDAVLLPAPIADAVAPRLPFLEAVDLGQEGLAEAARARVDVARDLSAECKRVDQQLWLAVRRPGPLSQGILAALDQPRAVYEQRVTALLADPEAHGGLRGRRGLFVPKAERQERASARTALADAKLEAVALKERYDGLMALAHGAERGERERLRIAIPGLSPAAAAVLGELGRTQVGRSPDPAVMVAVFSPARRSEFLAFAVAVGRRFGVYSVTGEWPHVTLGPDQWLKDDEWAIVTGAVGSRAT